MADFKDRLKELRLVNGMSQQELAARLKVHPMTISGYERGTRRPDFDTLDALADMLDADLDYLLGASDENFGYPRHAIESSLPKPALMRMAEQQARTDQIHQKLVQAYDAASPEIQQAVRRILQMEG